MKLIYTMLLLVIIMTTNASPAKKGIIAIMPPTTFRATKIYCELNDPAYVRINLCQCRLIRRGVSVINYNITHLQVVKAISLNYGLKKKAGWYKPFLFNYTINFCEYFKARNNPLVNFLYDYAKPYTNFNHSCPYEKGDVVLLGISAHEDILSKIPLPNGDYEISIIWYMNGKLTHSIKLYLEINKFDN